MVKESFAYAFNCSKDRLNEMIDNKLLRSIQSP